MSVIQVCAVYGWCRESRHLDMKLLPLSTDELDTSRPYILLSLGLARSLVLGINSGIGSRSSSVDSRESSVVASVKALRGVRVTHGVSGGEGDEMGSVLGNTDGKEVPHCLCNKSIWTSTWTTFFLKMYHENEKEQQAESKCDDIDVFPAVASGLRGDEKRILNLQLISLLALLTLHSSRYWSGLNERDFFFQFRIIVVLKNNAGRSANYSKPKIFNLFILYLSETLQL